MFNLSTKQKWTEKTLKKMDDDANEEWKDYNKGISETRKEMLDSIKPESEDLNIIRGFIKGPEPRP